MLAEEDKGLFILKIDSQGHEYHVLQGCVQYIRTHPVYYILLEFYPKGLRAVNIEPLTCFNSSTMNWDTSASIWGGKREITALWSSLPLSPIMASQILE